jgi:hypothetical protein
MPSASVTDTKPQGVVQTIFKGTTLRGLLLEAYAFSTVATIMLYGAITSFILAAVLAILAILAMLVGLGFWHAHRTSEETEMLRPPTKAVPAC